MPDSITPVALEWALTHITKYNDTDIFPRAFEFEAIRANWPAIRDYLSAQEFAEYKPETAFRILVPKAALGFRVAVQPGPLESILYAASVYEMANAIENHRVGASLNIACSFRVDLKADGSFFGESDGAADYHVRSKQLASSGKFSH